jgi:hypothetical protein
MSQPIPQIASEGISEAFLVGEEIFVDPRPMAFLDGADRFQIDALPDRRSPTGGIRHRQNLGAELSCAFSQAKVATLPLPEITTFLSLNDVW